MSTVGEEVRTTTSEDFGFKKLGQSTILPSYDEKLPFASLQNFDISNAQNKFAASSGGKVVIGDLQLLRDHIQNGTEKSMTFLWEKDVQDVIMVKILTDETLLLAQRGGSLCSLDLKSMGELKEIKDPACQVVQTGLMESTLRQVLFVLDDQKQLTGYDIGSGESLDLLSSVSSFDRREDKLYIFMDDYSIKFYDFVHSTRTLTLQSEFQTPSELIEEFKDQYYPINISFLDAGKVLLVYGEISSETDDSVMYEHKIFVMDVSTSTPSFQESFDITPAFGSVLRYPTYYNVELPRIVPDCEVVNILASSCSSEVTIWDSEEVIQPSQDSERAVLPINKETDNDTNPVGVSLDVVTVGAITNPCPGVDSIEELPLIYILNNEGSIQIVGLYHSSAIKNNTFNLKPLKELILNESTTEPDKDVQASENSSQAHDGTGLSDLKLDDAENAAKNKLLSNSIQSDNQSKSSSNEDKASDSVAPGELVSGSKAKKEINAELSKPHENTIPTSGLNELSLGTSDRGSAFGKSTFGNTGNSSAFGKSRLGQPSSSSSENAFGKPSFGKTDNASAFGKSLFDNTDNTSAFGKPSFGNTKNTSAFGKPSFGSTDNAPAFGKPSFGSTENAPAFGKPSFGSTENVPAFGKPSFGSTENAPAFGKPSFGNTENAPAFGKPSFGNTENAPAFGKPSFGNIESAPAFGKLSLGSAEKTSAFGKPSFGSTENTPAFGKPSFGSTENAPTFGKPSFGSTENTSAFGKPSFGSTENTSAFGKPSFGSTENTSAFGKPSFGSTENAPAFGKLSLGSSENAPAFGMSSSAFGKNEAAPAFGSNNSTPGFGKASFGVAESKSKFSIPGGVSEYNKSSGDGKESVSAFGKPSFGVFDASSPFSKKSPNGESASAFGKAFDNSTFANKATMPSFGMLSSSPSSKDKPLFSGFGNLNSDTSKIENPFLSNKQSPFATVTSKGNNIQIGSSKESKDVVESESENSQTSTINEPESNEPRKQKPPEKWQSNTGNSDCQEVVAPSLEQSDIKGEVSLVAREKIEDDDTLSRPAGQIDTSGEENQEEKGEEESGTSHDDNTGDVTTLSDSTVENTPSLSVPSFNSEKNISTTDSISSITARIKQNAKLSTTDLNPNKFESSSEKGEKSSSPFSSFANDLKIGPSSGFSFDNIIKARNEDSDNQSTVTKMNQEIPLDTLEKSSNSLLSKKPTKENILEQPDESESAEKDVVLESTHDEKNKSLSSLGSPNIDQSRKPQYIVTKTTLDSTNSPTSDPRPPESPKSDLSDSQSVNSEESYDALDDITHDELKNAVDSDQGIPLQVKRELNTKSISTLLSEPAIEAKPAMIQKSNQTEPIEYCDFEVQTFEEDGPYQALEHLPRPLKKYLTGADINQITYSSSKPTTRSMEKSYQLICAELSVLQENISNINEFMRDQSKHNLQERSSNSLSNVYTWRLSEAQKFHDILAERKRGMVSVNTIKAIDGVISQLNREILPTFSNDLKRLKELVEQFELMEQNPELSGLKYHQTRMRLQLREKMLKVSDELNHIQHSLQLLKLHAVKNEKLEGNLFVEKLSRELYDREDLLARIDHLREEIQHLHLRKESTSNQGKEIDISAVNDEIKLTAVVEVGLLLNSKKQFGSFFKSKAAGAIVSL